MTIREHLEKRLRWGTAAALSSLALVIIFGIMSSDEGSPPLFFIGFIPFMATILYMNFGIRCPKCSGNLGLTIGHASMSFGSKHRISFCPYCGTSIDQEIRRGRE